VNESKSGDLGLTKHNCPLCKEHHPAEEGIVLYMRSFTCPDCGTKWQDLWCSDCNDRCPGCDSEIEPEPSEGQPMVYEEPGQLTQEHIHSVPLESD
jgi:hypothetical protein